MRISTAQSLRKERAGELGQLECGNEPLIGGQAAQYSKLVEVARTVHDVSHERTRVMRLVFPVRGSDYKFSQALRVDQFLMRIADVRRSF